MMRGHSIFCNPPLIINEAQVRCSYPNTMANTEWPLQIREGFKIIDEGLYLFDEAMHK